MGTKYSDALEATYPLTIALEEIIGFTNKMNQDEAEAALGAFIFVEDFNKKHDIIDEQTSKAILAGVRKFIEIKKCQ